MSLIQSPRLLGQLEAALSTADPDLMAVDDIMDESVQVPVEEQSIFFVPKGDAELDDEYLGRPKDDHAPISTFHADGVQGPSRRHWEYNRQRRLNIHSMRQQNAA